MALVNAKNGIQAVLAAIAFASTTTQAINAYMAKRQGKAVAEGLKPEIDAQQEELLKLRELLERSLAGLTKANEEFGRVQQDMNNQQMANDRKNAWMGLLWYVLGAATPVALKYGLGVG